jgi:RNA-binding protein PNO1
MPAPTALLRKPDELAEALATPLPAEDDFLIDAEASGANPDNAVATTVVENDVDMDGIPSFPPQAKSADGPYSSETRKVLIPPHRMTPLKKAWPDMYPPLVEHLHLR